MDSINSGNHDTVVVTGRSLGIAPKDARSVQEESDEMGEHGVLVLSVLVRDEFHPSPAPTVADGLEPGGQHLGDQRKGNIGEIISFDSELRYFRMVALLSVMIKTTILVFFFF